MKYLWPVLYIGMFCHLGSNESLAEASGQSLDHCQAEDQSFSSKYLPSSPQGDWIVHYRAFFPKGYSSNKHYSVVYFLHGRGGDRFLLDSLEYCAQLDSLVDHAGNPFIAIAPEGQNSYWMNGALTHLRWGDVIAKELIADVENKFPIYKSQEGRMIAGISMGGHGAIQLDLNYPGVYGAVAAHSPVFRTQEEATRDFYYEFGTGKDYQSRDPFSLMMILGKKINVPLWMDMGAADPWLRNTRNFADYLISLKQPMTLHVGEDREGGHAFEYWHYHLSSYLEWYSLHLKKSE